MALEKPLSQSEGEFLSMKRNSGRQFLAFRRPNMSQGDNWWARQFTEGAKEIALTYGRFLSTRDVEDYEKAYRMCEELNETWGMELELLDIVELGRVRLAKQTLPHTLVENL
jgi:hypothetical protein